jgi:hypothetical protein
VDDGTLGHRGAALLGATMELSGLLDPEGALGQTEAPCSDAEFLRECERERAEHAQAAPADAQAPVPPQKFRRGHGVSFHDHSALVSPSGGLAGGPAPAVAALAGARQALELGGGSLAGASEAEGTAVRGDFSDVLIMSWLRWRDHVMAEMS